VAGQISNYYLESLMGIQRLKHVINFNEMQLLMLMDSFNVHISKINGNALGNFGGPVENDSVIGWLQEQFITNKPVWAKRHLPQRKLIEPQTNFC
jgi:hypothetical protein